LPTDKRRPILHVLYTDNDLEAMKGNRPVTEIGNGLDEIGNQADQQAIEEQHGLDTEYITRSVLKDTDQRSKKKYSAEAAPGNPGVDGVDCSQEDKDGAFLARIERLLPTYRENRLSWAKVKTVRDWRNRCEEISLKRETHQGDPVGGRAFRLGGELHAILEANHTEMTTDEFEQRRAQMLRDLENNP
jgi:hypothetical protein